MSQPYITNCDDGSVLIEWILPDARFYISLEKNASESSWGYITKSGTMMCNQLPACFLETLNAVREVDG